MEVVVEDILLDSEFGAVIVVSVVQTRSQQCDSLYSRMHSYRRSRDSAVYTLRFLFQV